MAGRTSRSASVRRVSSGAPATPPPMSQLQGPGSAKPQRQSGAGAAGSPEKLVQPTAKAALDALAATLTSKLADSFGEAAADEASRRIVVQEVQRFMETCRTISEKDIAQLEARVRTVLAGDSPPRTEKTERQMAIVEADEWARLQVYQAKMAELDSKARKERQAAQQAALRLELDKQRDVVAATRAAEEAEKKRFAEQQALELQQWQLEQRQRRERKIAAINSTKAEVEAQLKERERKKALESSLKQREEEEEANRMLQDTRAQMEADLAAQHKAKEDLKALLLGNEENRRAKLAAKEREREGELHYMEQYAEMLDRQAEERRSKQEAVKQRQLQQAVTAAARPEAKRWIDPAIIERTCREKDEAVARDQSRRAAVQAAAESEFTCTLADQVKAKEAAKRAEREAIAAERQDLDRQLEEERARKEADRASAAAKKRAFKESLDNQVRLAESRKIAAQMSNEELKINAALLKKLEAAGAA